MQTSIHVNFSGQCEEAFRFYERHLGGKIEVLLPYEATPVAKTVPADFHKKLVHARMNLGGNILMGCDAAC